MIICLGKQMKKLTFIVLILHVPHAAVKLMIQTVNDACNDLFFRHHGLSSLILSHSTYPNPTKVTKLFLLRKLTFPYSIAFSDNVLRPARLSWDCNVLPSSYCIRCQDLMLWG